ncbi:MAG: discoidin domain-containing protein [Candidatus Sulfopaludibacter sp.]|nr:discoidin domain-containing protein [Candidatus Sulfopaludibacter sp.]
MPPTKANREIFMDDNTVSALPLRGARAWIEFGLEGADSAPEVDRIVVVARVPSNQQWFYTVSGSSDRKTWQQLGRAAGGPVTFAGPSRNRYYRIDFESAGIVSWQVAEVRLFDGNQRVRMGGPFHFASAWKSAGHGGEWVYVDLGAPCAFDRVAVYWIRRPADGAIQVSNDARTWRTIQVLPAAGSLNDDLKLARPERGRYVRVLMTRAASPEGYILSEMEVYGRGGVTAVPKAAAVAQSGGRLPLAGGAWRLQRDSLVQGSGEAISTPGFHDGDWVIATVPGTVLTSYLNVGAVPNPDFGDNQLQISDSFFYADFWYRDEFTAPRAVTGERAWLNFDGINWKADVYFNGARVGRIEGGFMRGRFDVTNLIHPGARNALAVRIQKPATPGSVKEKGAGRGAGNGGALGADNPTYHASAGWDWMSTIRGRNIGIWADVYLTPSGPVTIENPWSRRLCRCPIPRAPTSPSKSPCATRNRGPCEGRCMRASDRRPSISPSRSTPPRQRS